MSEISVTGRTRIEGQGFLALDDRTLAQINYWLCLSPAICMAGAAWAFQAGHPLVGQILGWSLVAAAFMNVSIGFCIPSFIYGLVFGKPSSCAARGQSR